jgi:hypothetical protein
MSNSALDIGWCIRGCEVVLASELAVRYRKGLGAG